MNRKVERHLEDGENGCNRLEDYAYKMVIELAEKISAKPMDQILSFNDDGIEILPYEKDKDGTTSVVIMYYGVSILIKEKDGIVTIPGQCCVHDTAGELHEFDFGKIEISRSHQEMNCIERLDSYPSEIKKMKEDLCDAIDSVMDCIGSDDILLDFSNSGIHEIEWMEIEGKESRLEYGEKQGWSVAVYSPSKALRWIFPIKNLHVEILVAIWKYLSETPS